jgi:hypothetical protein
MVTELPPPPAPLVERLEASFPSPYEYLWANEGETPSEALPEEPVRLAFAESAMANPIKLLLDRLGFAFRPLFGEIRHERMPVTENSTGGEPAGVGGDPIPAGDPIPVDGGGRPGG